MSRAKKVAQSVEIAPVAKEIVKPFGRPRAEVDPKAVEILAGAFCTNEEIAAKVGICSDTLVTHFSEYLKRGRDSAKSSLRAKQFAIAMSGNPVLLIWLGKQYLDQRDSINVMMAKMTDEELFAEIGAIPNGFDSTTESGG